MAGYDEPSLSERIYWDGDRNGILIYATGSSDGSLGGFSGSGGLSLKKRLLKLEQQ
mgnify:CR=1 FL=1